MTDLRERIAEALGYPAFLSDDVKRVDVDRVMAVVRPHVARAEAAVLACEKRMSECIPADCCVCGSCGHAQAEPNWCHKCGHRTVPAPWVALHDAAVRRHTIAEIVEALRAEFQRFSEDSMATDYDLAMRDGWIYAADLIESRFAAKEEEDDDAVS